MIYFGNEYSINKNILSLICNYYKNFITLNEYDIDVISEHLLTNYNKYIVIEKLINHEPNLANILPLIINDILQYINKNIQNLIISEKIINKDEYNKQFCEFHFNDICNEFIIKKSNTNCDLYNLLIYFFYAKYILNYKTNVPYEFGKKSLDSTFGKKSLASTFAKDYLSNLNLTKKNNIVQNLSHIYFSKYWNFIVEKLSEENILNTIEYEDLNNFFQIVDNKYWGVKKYLIENKLQFAYINDSDNLRMRITQIAHIFKLKRMQVYHLYMDIHK